MLLWGKEGKILVIFRCSMRNLIFTVAILEKLFKNVSNLGVVY
jgi:hypothetical protein